MRPSLYAGYVLPQVEAVTFAILNEQVRLPSLPKLVAHIRAEISSHKSTAKSIAKLIAQDPTLAANILRFANSPLYGTLSTVETLPRAVQRLGLTFVSSLAVATVSRQLFHARSPWTATQLDHIWSHSVRTAGLSKILAQEYRMDEDLALLAGLLHNIGSFVVLAHMEETPDLFVVPERLNYLLSETRVEAGLALARHWNLPDEITKTIKDYSVLSGASRTSPVAVKDVVRAAGWFLANAEHREGHVKTQRSNALSRLGVPADADLLAKPATREQVDAITRLLG